MGWKRLMAEVCTSAVLVAGCGDDGGGSSEGGGGGGGDAKITGNKVIDPGSMDSEKGNVSFCTGKDTSGSKTAGVKAFNQANPGLTVKLIEFPSPPTSSATSSSSARRPRRTTATSSAPT
jgi:hypothetical protein